MVTRNTHGGPPKEVIEQALRQFREQEEKRQRYQQSYGHGRVPVCARMGDRWTVAVAGGIYMQSQSGGYNFANLVLDYTLHFLGEKFLDAEETKPFGERHQVVQWMNAYVEHCQRLEQDGSANPGASQVGVGAEWFRFAYDVYMISDNSKLEARLKRRLLDPRKFQSARYELEIAAIFVVAGFEVHFEDEDDNSCGHTEFIAIDRFSPARVAVEVKSRHRRGSYGFQGGKDVAPGAVVDVRDNVLAAYEKKTDLPFYVFVSTNLPPFADLDDYDRWQAELEQAMNDLAAEGYADPCPANIVFFTNDPSHYLGLNQIGNDFDRVWVRRFTAAKPRVPHPSVDVGDRIFIAHQQRMRPPTELPDFQ